MKRASEVKSKAFFIIFKGLSITRHCLRPEKVPLNITSTIKEINKCVNKDLEGWVCYISASFLYKSKGEHL